MSDNEKEIASEIAKAQRGYVIAAAGCGKTEQIARATKHSITRRLILTHTNAGVDVLRTRLNALEVPPARYRLDTIAGWSLRYAGSFPALSGLGSLEGNLTDWELVYSAALSLVAGGYVDSVISASYGGLFVDEYQDCNEIQHNLVIELAKRLPTCIFGDPLQAIFDFDGQKVVDWEASIFPAFVKVAQLTTPHRWLRVGSNHIAEWLQHMRANLQLGKVDFASLPKDVTWSFLPDDVQRRTQVITGSCQSAHGRAGAERLIVIADRQNINARTMLAQKIANLGFSNIEPIGCAPLYAAAAQLEKSKGLDRLRVLLDFASSCMTGLGRADFDRGVASSLAGGKAMRTRFGHLIDLAIDVVTRNSDESAVGLLKALPKIDGSHLYCRERYIAFVRAIEIRQSMKLSHITDGVWQIQNRMRHAGRKVGRRAVGSTLLLKGLECEHAVVVHSHNMSPKDWYVSITRASKSLSILSPKIAF
jgi:hypothetical protein